MKNTYYIFIALILVSVFWVFYDAEAARVEFMRGMPVVVEDGVVGDTTENGRVEFQRGVPSIVWDTTEQPPVITQLHYRWREDNGSESAASYAANEDTSLTDNVFSGDRRRLRTLISNTGSGSASNITYRLEHASTTCTSWLAVPTTSTLSSEHWLMDLSSNVADAAATTDSSGLSNPAGTFVAGQVKTSGNQTTAHTLTGSNTQFTELEYSIKSTGNVTTGITYCFRLTNAGSTTNFSYSVQPQITISGRQRPTGGGINVESSGSGTQQPGGGAGGGAGVEEGGSGGQQSGGSSGGGGSVE